jgi:hypothetical protein
MRQYCITVGNQKGMRSRQLSEGELTPLAVNNNYAMQFRGKTKLPPDLNVGGFLAGPMTVKVRLQLSM